MPAHQLTALAGALATGTVVAAAALLGAAPAAAPAPIAVVAPDLTLTAVPTFEQSLKVLLDTMLGIGDKTLGDLVDPHNDATVEHALNGWTVDVGGTATPLGLSADVSLLFQALSLDDISFSALLGPVVPADKLSELLGAGGPLESLGSASLDSLTAGFGGINQPLASFLDQSGIGGATVGQIFDGLGYGQGKTMDDLLAGLGWGGNWQRLEGFFPMLGLQPTTGALDGIAKLTGNTITATTSLNDLFGTGGLLEKIGDIHVNTLVGLPDNETLLNLLTGLRWGDATSTETWGDLTLAQILGWLTFDPSKSLAWNLGNLPISLDGSTDLGTASLGSFLTALMPADLITGTAVGGVDTDTTLGDYLDSLFGSSMTLDGFLGLDGVDISEWS